MTTAITSRRAKSELRVVQQQPISDRERAFSRLESDIRDVSRATRIAFLMNLHGEEHDEGLGLFAVQQADRLASELVKAFYAAWDGKAVQS